MNDKDFNLEKSAEKELISTSASQTPLWFFVCLHQNELDFFAHRTLILQF